MSSQVSYKGGIMIKLMIGNSLRALPGQCQFYEEDGNNAVVGGLGDYYDHGDEVNDQKMPN